MTHRPPTPTAEDSAQLAHDLAASGKLPGWTYLDILTELVPLIRRSGWLRERTVRLEGRGDK